MSMPSTTPLRPLVGPVILLACLSQAWILRSVYAIISTGSLLVLAATGACLYAVIKDEGTKRAGYDHRQRRRALKQLSVATPPAWSAMLVKQTWEDASSDTHLRANPAPNLLSARVLAKLVPVLRLIRSSFILPWYSRISTSAAFPDAVDDLVLRAIANIVHVAEPVDWSRLMISRVLPILKDHLRHYRSVEHLGAEQASPSAVDSRLPLPKNAHPALSGLVHAVESSSPAIESHLRSIVSSLIDTALPADDQSVVVTIIVRELLLESVLLPIFDMLCDGDFWNRTIEDKGTKYLQERKQVDQFLTALSTLPSTTPGQTPRKSRGSTVKGKGTATTSTISAASSSQQFEAFLKSIAKIDSLGEARRLRADVDRELRLARTSLDLHGGAESAAVAASGKATKRSRNYVARLERAATAIDKKTSALGALTGEATSRMFSSPLSSLPAPTAEEGVSLQAILSDPSSLAYWLEFMERRAQSRLVQCWLTLEGLKDPLDPLDVIGLQSPSESAARSFVDLPSASFQSFTEDVALLYDTHFKSDKIQPYLPATSIADIRAFATSAKESMTMSDVRKVKKALQACQTAILERMEEVEWPYFKKSELFVKAVSDLARSGHKDALQPALPVTAGPPLPNLPISPTNTADVSVPQREQRRKGSGAPNETSGLHPGLRSPPARTALALLNGNSTPRSIAAAASLSLSPPTFERGFSGSSRRATDPSSPVPSMPPTPSIEQSVALPGLPSRKASQLDFLISGVSAESLDNPPIHKRTLFQDNDEPEVESGDDMDNEDTNADAERMEAIRAALTEIISSGGAAPMSESREPSSNMSASMVLLSQAQKQHDRAQALGSGTRASRSAEDLATTRDTKSITASAASSRLPSASGSFAPRPTTTRQGSASKPSNAGARSKLFEDDSESDGPEAPSDVEKPDEGMDSVDARGTIQLAGPGDLHLGPKIARLQDRIQELVKQDQLLLSLIAQAELTGSSHELRILKRSHSAVRLEQRTILFQKAQFEQQEEENRLCPRRTRVSIPSTKVVTESDGKQVVRYHVRITQINPESEQTTEADGQKHHTSWTLIRRFNEFWELDRGLREHLGSGPTAEGIKRRMAKMPEKTLVASLSPSFVENRRTGLERYLQAMVGIEDLCQHPLVITFLSSSQGSSTVGSAPEQASMATVAQALAPHDIVKSLYRTMATSLDDSQLGPSTLDMMYTTLSRQLNEVAGGFGGVLGSLTGLEVDSSLLPANILKAGAPYTPTWLRPDPVTTLLPAASSPSPVAVSPIDRSVKAGGGQDTSQLAPIGGETGSNVFSAPICDLFIELFELKESNWIRRQAIVIILQQLLGSTIERKVRDSFKKAMSEESFERGIGLLQDTLWPGGERRPPSEPRSAEEKARTRYRASKTLPLLIPDVVANMVGRGNAKRAARRIFEMLQDKRLNQHLVLCLLDEVLKAVLPPIPHATVPRPAGKTGD